MQVILPAHERICQVAEEWWRFIAVLRLALGEVDALGEEAAGSSCLEAFDFETEFAQAVAECRNRIAESTPALVSQADMEQAAHKSAGCNHHGAAVEAQTEIGFHTLDAIFPHHEAGHVPLFHVQSWLALEERLHTELIRFLVALSAGCAHARALRGIQHAELDAGGVGVQTHRASEGVDLTNHVPLCQTADRGVAGHLPNCVGILSEQESFAAQPRGGHGGFYACMPRTDDDDIVGFWIDEVAQVTQSASRARRVSFAGLRRKA